MEQRLMSHLYRIPTGHSGRTPNSWCALRDRPFSWRRRFAALVFLTSLAVIGYDGTLLWSGEIHPMVGGFLLVLGTFLAVSSVGLIRHRKPSMLRLFAILGLVALSWYVVYSFAGKDPRTIWVLLGLIWVIALGMLVLFSLREKRGASIPAWLLWGMPIVAVVVTLSILLVEYTTDFLWAFGIFSIFSFIGLTASVSGTTKE